MNKHIWVWRSYLKSGAAETPGANLEVIMEKYVKTHIWDNGWGKNPNFVENRYCI